MAAGRVCFVGAGPGDPGLLTARALELIAAADVILYDRLIPDEALAGARADAELRYVGKEGGGVSVRQEEILELLLARAAGGSLVVRLKGGDPFVFGRGGEEAQAVRAAGIAFEVVPGVTAAVAAAAYAGIPVTHRDLASAVALVTAHEDPTKASSALDWEALAAFPGTLVFYMGVRQLEAIAARLIGAGRAPDEPAAVVERGTLPGQRVVHGRLETIALLASQASVKAPAITIVGAVAALGHELAWVGGEESGPLVGLTVAVTRARAQSSGLAGGLRELGATVVEAPAIRIVAREVELPELAGIDLLCLTSPNGVAILFDRLAERGEDARALAGATVAAIGPGTARALAERGIRADVVPERFVAEALAASLEGLLVRRALIARAAQARDVLPDALRARGVEVCVVALYDTLAEPLSVEALAAARSADYITFTSSSTVRFFLEVGEIGPLTRIVSIGPVTSATLREHGYEPHVEAARHDIDGLVAALVDDAADR
ncbi:MAG: uroporphyrinogen-III C-methyltransferase [Solirubrobacteraceae bacterium]